MSKEHVVNCRCGLMGVPEQHNCQKQPFVALLAGGVRFLAKASHYFAVFDRSVPDKAHLVAQNSSLGCFHTNRWTNWSLIPLAHVCGVISLLSTKRFRWKNYYYSPSLLHLLNYVLQGQYSTYHREQNFHLNQCCGQNQQSVDVVLLQMPFT